MEETESMQALALKAMKQLGRKYPEIKEFKKIPGIGEILSHGTLTGKLRDRPHVLLP